MTHETLTSRTAKAVPARSTEDPAPAGNRAGETAGAAPPVPLDRLVSVAVLTPAQATVVAVALLDAAATRGDHRDGEQPFDVRLGAVLLEPSGEVDVGQAYADDGTRVGDVLAQLLQNARRLPAHPKPEQLSLLRRLEETVAGPVLAPGARARELEAALADSAGPRWRERLTGQLAALVRAFAHVAHTAAATPGGSFQAVPVHAAAVHAAPDAGPHRPPTPTTATGSSHSAPRRRSAAAAPPGRAPRRRGSLLHRRTRGRRVAIIALVLAAVLAGSGYVMLRGSDLQLPGLGSDEPSSPASTAPAPPAKQPAKQTKQTKPAPPRAVPALAPRRAGPINAVAVQKAGTCRPGAACPVTVTVRFRPTATSRTVGWKVGVARVCTKRDVAWSAPVAVTAQPGWSTVYASSSVEVPQGRRPLALVALTTKPDRAQSRPVPIAGASLRC